jgi:hypothetical protein
MGQLESLSGRCDEENEKELCLAWWLLKFSCGNALVRVSSC